MTELSPSPFDKAKELESIQEIDNSPMTPSLKDQLEQQQKAKFQEGIQKIQMILQEYGIVMYGMRTESPKGVVWDVGFELKQ